MIQVTILDTRTLSAGRGRSVVPELLTNHRRVRSSDPEEAREQVGEVFCPHRLEPARGSRSLATRFNAVDVGTVGLSYLTYGAEVRIRPEPLRTFVLVQIPLTGRALVRGAGTEVFSDSRTATILDPDARFDMRWSADNAQLIIRLDRAALTRCAERLPDSAPPRLPSALDLTVPAVRSWLATVHLLRSDLDGPAGLRHPALQAQVEQLVIAQFVTALAVPSTPPPAAAPRTIRRAEQLIVDHAREPLTVEDVAEAVGLSVRALQEGFRRHIGVTPTARLREARLIGVRTELAAADPQSSSVSRIAAGWGFWHLGRFAIAYRERWGESPSVTLRS